MDERVLGRTGLRVSAIGLGTLTWGRDTEADTAAELLGTFVEAGGSLVDTAASYGDGAAELLLGTLIGEVAERDDLVLVTKAGVRRAATGSLADTSRRALLDSLDASLTRLRTDHVDVFCVQQPDAVTPADEVARTLEHILDSGRARYVALANHPAWRTVRVADLLAPQRLAAVEVEYSLLQRGVEREVLAAAREIGAGVLAWSPLGRGVLTGKYRRSVPADSRAASAHLSGFVEPYLGSAAAPVVEAVVTAADGLGCAPLEVALAWVLARDIASAIVGARTPAQLRPVLASSLVLPPEIVTALDEVSAPALGYPERR
ncbi:aldo/keto reductase [Actinotalea sp. M2MS4P-6]|uniref:aldo/keto reductase n=1 Tax=Actinotalea sp. M2MS4P-6 TaxID=2983762 RepID=UPI0021E3AB75|nr:aldo/keto reductase [Actinotalea sp. M2MS4P-6]MCV2394818.1 aldo/keto reductase [Actinotalea sp. M2MS4P-6]